MTTYDWIKSFLKITEEGRAIYGNLDTVIRLIRFTGQWKISFLKITIKIVKVTAALYNLLLYNLTLKLSEIKIYCNR